MLLTGTELCYACIFPSHCTGCCCSGNVQPGKLSHSGTRKTCCFVCEVHGEDNASESLPIVHNNCYSLGPGVSHAVYPDPLSAKPDQRRLYTLRLSPSTRACWQAGHCLPSCAAGYYCTLQTSVRSLLALIVY